MKKTFISLLCLIVGAAGCVAPSAQVNTSPARTRTAGAPEPGAAALPQPGQIAQVEEVEEVDPHQLMTNGGLDEPAKFAATDYQCKPVPAPVEKDAQQILDEALASCQAAQDYWQKGELDQAIDALDQAYAMLLSIEADNGGPGVLQAKEDLRFLISKRMLEIYTSRFTAATGNHNAIPLDMNKYVEAEIKLFTGREKNFFISSYQRSGQYRPQIVKALREAGLPEELSWLPLIESGFKVKALSSARALGMWQFIASTGYKFGLSRDRYIDERMDPEKSTQAAIAYLKELHSMFGDWTTCLAAYNCGEGRVLRVIQRQNVNYLDNFWDLYTMLPRETARYVPRFLAALHIINDPAKYGMDLGVPYPPLEYETVSINKQVHLNHVASAIGVSKETLKDLNPELRYQITPERPYELKTPPGKSGELLACIDRISKYEFPQDAYVLHRIRRGETLSTIARKYGTSVSKIKRANSMRSTRIVAGKTLKVPIGRGYSAPAASQPVASTPAVHVVRRGDSLWNIAQRYGSTINDIKEANNLKTTTLSVGQKLTIPGKSQTNASGSRTYVVKRGDTPSTIARKHGMSLNQLLALNGLHMKSTIYPGQKILVK
ncbi:membrane-bound lytic murein transglycosylase D [Desulfatibacillum alkenivorans DSM 16219]|jgi:membrane-bound lytic murein transglycosylase D|uniref:Membrane-bound lytic murein transglycosylase D n=1 Tax=Desulfatibacillum alkenivorans DSM 16219 TaxID=1121393 RepID=A0A1M7B892_9BACT|nr:LysM peptidoglycan-binding domain-containing protein [Desulfatibacillum alkenivorans]SHL51245.1 membrane-bound lytic murein transglycosylase D [Desulfatibacillum alkenivorans DSM 16219]